MPDAKDDLNIQTRGKVRLVEFTERKILEELQIQQIGEQLRELTEEGPNPQILLDFRNVEHLSSAALSVLITLNKRVTESEGRLVLARIRPQILEVFKITRLNRLFDIQDDLDKAFQAFA